MLKAKRRKMSLSGMEPVAAAWDAPAALPAAAEEDWPAWEAAPLETTSMVTLCEATSLSFPKFATAGARVNRPVARGSST